GRLVSCRRSERRCARGAAAGEVGAGVLIAGPGHGSGARRTGWTAEKSVPRHKTRVGPRGSAVTLKAYASFTASPPPELARASLPPPSPLPDDDHASLRRTGEGCSTALLTVLGTSP